jgi:hypothetical protein
MSSRSRYEDGDRRRSMPARDDEGPFTSSRSRHDDEDRRRSMPARDDEGRFTSSRSRYEDDDDYRRGSRGHDGWYGAIRRAIRKPRIAAGRSVAVPTFGTATMMMTAGMRARGPTKAASSARAPMTTGVAAAGMAAGTGSGRALGRGAPRPKVGIAP